MRLLCSRSKTPDQKDERQLKKLLRCVQDTKYDATEFKANGVDTSVLKIYTDSDWARDPKSSKSTSVVVILNDGCRIHAHS